ncbi:hypothetical protein G6F70_006704 [Rhizopus microsporus]|nr:hypothetical protein G6F71_006673 [Rhizopus microsporus]KAG1197340.1 hypothetical protein G6F70_006704 [Rhizopus microsporus]KAG1212738.1 hypothetical protein G6F69_003438 [Rhizopus microsporus]KAG1235128.1 hypothetical protein G6F67_002993 [Rhizopus microsporus]KAG1265796.1 hypothetical protein G6F68_003286 [Rhizopus microsporus]
MHAMVNERQIYRADGVVRLGVTEDLEVGILKTAEPFKSDKAIRFWSMKYTRNRLYDFARKEKVELSEEFADKEETLVNLATFFLGFKDRLQETMRMITSLKNQYQEKRKNRDGNDSNEVAMSNIVCLKIFKISFKTHGRRFCKEYLQNPLPESDY